MISVVTELAPSWKVETLSVRMDLTSVLALARRLAAWSKAWVSREAIWSPFLIEGAPADFSAWLRRFLPDMAKGEPKSLFEPAKVTDRTDPQLVHLDGLNLSRAWCMRSIATALPKDDPARKVLAESAQRHAEAALRHVASGDYAGEHWLASFAVHLLSTPSPD